MAIGQISPQNPLGLANVAGHDVNTFLTNVMQMNVNSIIYQQQLVHGTADVDGPHGGAECSPTYVDLQYAKNVVRQLSPHDTVFGKRNLSDSVINLVNHRLGTKDQIYYLVNEPEAFSSYVSGASCSGCWEPTTQTIDGSVAPLFNPNSLFWESGSGGTESAPGCTNGNFWRIRFSALAQVYDKVRRETIGLSKGHVVLPPASSVPELGGSAETNDYSKYWKDFFDLLKNRYGLGPSHLKALHLHHYSAKPTFRHTSTDPNFDETQRYISPFQSVAFSAALIIKAADWYRTTYTSLSTLPMDIMLSEMGVHHSYTGYTADNRKWAGGFNNYKDALSWWNTYLCWLTRIAPSDCKLATDYKVYACIHEPDTSNVYVTSNAPSAEPPGETQTVLNFISGNFHRAYLNNPTVFWKAEIGKTDKDSRFRKSFISFPRSSDPNNRYRLTPLGACFTVWSQVGADSVMSSLNEGWVYSNAAGRIGSGCARISVTNGFNTVYFPIIKMEVGPYPVGTQIHSTFYTAPDGGNMISYGYMDLKHGYTDLKLEEFPDSKKILKNDWWLLGANWYDHTIYSAMVYPVVIYTDLPVNTHQNLYVSLNRNISGPGVFLGRPVCLEGGCTWFTGQG